LAELRAECATGISPRIREKVREIVPEYQWVPEESELPAPAALLYPSPIYNERATAAVAND
jgi:hypothetical protein